MQLRSVSSALCYFSFVTLASAALALPACISGYPGGQLGIHGKGGAGGTAGQAGAAGTGATAGAGASAGHGGAAGSAGSAGAPCANVVCDTPPINGCLDDGTYLALMPNGECNPLNGECDYPGIEIPCPGCFATCQSACTGVACPDEQGGCLTGGYCDPTSGGCVYEEAAPGERCDRSGTGDGVCVDGSCEALIPCTSANECDDGNPCTVDTCVNDACIVEPTTPGSQSCDDGNPCTYDDACGEGGLCEGTSITCVSDTSVCGAVRGCNGTSTCTEVYPGPSKGCDDGNLCTYGDACNGGGACVGTAISCTSDGGICGVERFCNGTAVCSEYIPDGSTECGVCGHCNGSGSCVGQCSGGQQCCEGTICAAQCP